MSEQEMPSEIRKFVANLPQEIVVSLAKTIQSGNSSNKERLRVKAVSKVAQPSLKARVNAFFNAWDALDPQASSESVALGILTAAEVEEYYRQYQTLELVWTGPKSDIIPLRRTDQALLELINDAEESVHIVSYAVYKAKSIYDALAKAAKRGVSTVVYLETPDSSEGKMTLDTVRSLGKEVEKHSHIYIWPLNKREQTADGKHGSLHAKIAIADGRVMLISSANLTEYAMTLNMEMGVLICGGPLPKQVEEHLGRLIEQGTFELVL